MLIQRENFECVFHKQVFHSVQSQAGCGAFFTPSRSGRGIHSARCARAFGSGG